MTSILEVSSVRPATFHLFILLIYLYIFLPYNFPIYITADHVTKTAFHISLCHIKQHSGVIAICLFHNSLIIHGIIHQIVFGYFVLYFLLFISIKYDIKIAQKIVNNSIKENRLPLKVSLLLR